MRTVESLLDEAIDVCHGQAELARRLGTSAPAITEMKKGTRPISPETVALLADVVGIPGEEAQRLAALAVIGAAKNASKREKLRRAFFGCWVVGVVALLTTLTPQPSTASDDTRVSPNTHCRASPYVSGVRAVSWQSSTPACPRRLPHRLIVTALPGRPAQP
ncbi:helix-turn-helix domain-containing protein [Ideonella sp.]|uniref:helix-turn-helix domain-containing protein n=1 Tax=Ideonella sp. TaxID=1929293 RepID=UPI0035B49F23